MDGHRYAVSLSKENMDTIYTGIYVCRIVQNKLINSSVNIYVSGKYAIITLQQTVYT